MLALLSAHGCSPTDVFACIESSQCESVGVPGTCEASGFCSFPDPECDSGRRYGSLAGPLSNTCVDDDAGTTSTTSGGPTTSTTAGPLTTTAEPTTKGSTASETDALSSGPMSSSTTEDVETSTTSTSGDESSSTGASVAVGLVGWWRLNDDPEDGVLDSTRNGFDAECLGPCPELDASGGYYRFDGTPVLRIPGDAFGAASFTISVWTRPDQATMEPDPIVFTKPVGDVQWNSWGLHYDQILTQFEFVLGNAVMNTEVELMNVDLDGWHHFAGRFDGTGATLFVDGAAAGSASIPGGFFAVDDSAVYIGGDFDFNGPAEPRFSGDLDDVRYYEVALSDDEIAALAATAR